MRKDPPHSDAQAEKHWTNVYATRAEDAVSWYQAEPTLSLAMIRHAVEPPASVLDVGGGASRLVDGLLDRGYRVGVLDISEEPLAIVRRRLGDAGIGVEWLVADVRNFVSPHPWDVWHDRAVFHFLTDPGDRLEYRRALMAATRAGSQVIVATFGPAGPERCSGLPTMRYSPQGLGYELGAAFDLVETNWEDHHTPAGGRQEFVYCRFIRR